MPLTDRHSPLAGMPASAAALLDVDRLLAAYWDAQPDPSVAAQRVAFGTSGHRGSALDLSFNTWHVQAITQAICDQRLALGIGGPLFMGVDTHALSAPACASALQVLAANGVHVMLAVDDAPTPTPAVSLAILQHNLALGAGPSSRHSGRADGIVMTPSHNPPRDGGLKYNPPHGGPAGAGVTEPIQAAANAYLAAGLQGVRHLPHAMALRAATTHRHAYRQQYVAALDQVVDLAAIRRAGLRIGVDPLGGAGVHYWAHIADHWRLDLRVVSEAIDPQFGFMPLDWDGQVRMDPASPWAMQRLVGLRGQFDIAFGCDTDHDRHGIVCPAQGLLAPNHDLCVAADHLLRHRPQWPVGAAVGKTVVSTRLLERVARRLGRQVFDAPVGFKWFAAGLLDGSLGFAGEESAGAGFLRRDGSVWTTDKDGMAAGLLAAEITAVHGRAPDALYATLAAQLGNPVARTVASMATPAQQRRLATLSARQLTATDLAGERIEAILTRAPGNGEPIGGVQVRTASGWFAARPSGTEPLIKLYAESFQGPAHLQCLLQEAGALVAGVIGSA